MGQLTNLAQALNSAIQGIEILCQTARIMGSSNKQMQAIN